MKESKKYQVIQEELKRMVQKDQAMRFKVQDDPESWDDSIDRTNTARMKEIIDEIGWPTISKVGEEGSSNAWLLIQHADHDREFQKKCLKLMKTVPKNEVRKRDIAYLEDRIATSEGCPQIYGTQFHKNSEGAMEPLPIKDPENVDKRRKEVGLGALQEYQERLQQIWGH